MHLARSRLRSPEALIRDCTVSCEAHLAAGTPGVAVVLGPAEVNELIKAGVIKPQAQLRVLDPMLMRRQEGLQEENQRLLCILASSAGGPAAASAAHAPFSELETSWQASSAMNQNVRVLMDEEEKGRLRQPPRFVRYALFHPKSGQSFH